MPSGPGALSLRLLIQAAKSLAPGGETLEKSQADPWASRYGPAPFESLPLLEKVPDHALPSSLAMLLSTVRREPSDERIAAMLLTGPLLLQSFERRVAAEILLEFLREGGKWIQA